jgi:glycerol-3-phosphate O-acyltransferase
MEKLSNLGYRICRWFIGAIVRPRLAGGLPALPKAAPERVVYVLENRSLSDLIVLDLLSQQLQLPNPLDPIAVNKHQERQRMFFLNRASFGWFRRNTMSQPPARMVRLLTHAADAPELMLIPTAILWGRAPARERSLVRLLVSEHSAVTGRVKRLVNMFFSRKDIVVDFGRPLALSSLADPELDEARIVRRAARLLRVRLRNQRVATMGPDFSHQRTLVRQILNSRRVADAIEAQQQRQNRETPARLQRQARKAAMGIVSNMSYPTIRVLEHLLAWFWNRIYGGIEIQGLERVRSIAQTHTPIYTPSHRSHVDYLLLSYLLHENGLMLPHVAAGDNMNLPLIGGVLRRGGAFFMRRSFRDDPIYAAVFSEYLYQVYRRGHCVEFFPEGGRTRTGRLLPARLGLLKMTLEHHARGVPRPLAIVPVYFGYEKLIEASSYLEELRGSEKKRESLGDLLRSLRLIRQDFGRVNVNFGEPVDLGTWVEAQGPQQPSEMPAALGRDILQRINACAAINPINLVALVTLCTPRLAIDEQLLIDQIGCYLRLLDADSEHHDYTLTTLTPPEIIRYVEGLGMLQREQDEHGDVLSLDPFSAVLMTWYRNNVSHTLALPSLIACLVINRRRPLNKIPLRRMVDRVFPYLAAELHQKQDPQAVDRWLRHMVDGGLLQVTEAGGYSAPSVRSEARHQLHMLANVVMPSLERLYIVVGLLATETPKTREALQHTSEQVAKKMSRIYGLNAPEFFDAQLFHTFIDRLVADGIVSENADGSLGYAQVVRDVLKAAEGIIDTDFRSAVLRAG